MAGEAVECVLRAEWAMEEQERKENADRAEPELLYHYTTEKGLYGILESDTIWATHYKFLNDSSERTLGFDIYRNATESVDRSTLVIPQHIMQAEREVLCNYFNEIDAYVVSFTKDSWDYGRDYPGDRLSQWRGCAQGTQGYCLGFSSTSISEIAANLHRLICIAGILRDCTYSEKALMQVVDEQRRAHLINLRRIAESFFMSHQDKSEYVPAQNKDFMDEVRRHAVEMITECSLYKHPAFWEEDEVRLLAYFVKDISGSQKVKLRDGQLGKTPYLEIPLSLKGEISPLKKIVVGPSAFQDQARARLHILLEQMRIRNAEVVPSKIPYRNW